MTSRLPLVLALAAVVACHDPLPAKPAASREQMAQRLAGIAPGEERDMGEGTFMKMFRIGASDPLADGWNVAHSTEGAFTVELPLPFNDFRIRGETADRVPMRMHMIGAKSPGLLAWSATCIARRDGTLGHPPGPDKIEVVGTPPKAQSRTVDFEDMSCVLIVEAQGTDPLPAETDRLRFLRSLKRTGKPVW